LGYFGFGGPIGHSIESEAGERMVAEHYGIAYISTRDAFYENNMMSGKTSDSLHPTTEDNNYYGSLLYRFFMFKMQVLAAVSY